MVTLFTLALFFLVSAPVPGNGAIASLEYEEVFDDPLLEARARSLSRQIRCVVCQNQSIAGSGADIARAMRFRVRERLRKGDSDGEVLNHFAERYGDFILLRPSVKGNTLFLWFFPPFILIFGACLVWILSRRYSPVVNDGETGELTPDEADRVRTLLEERLPS
ncbi:MAG: cytochrome c-type biogenesis protein CcmH [Alphaproteobacteria bacterium]|nr:cytochrome c-type biogenesis protein CcmH [Alphaproteobacteria bacterium]